MNRGLILPALALWPMLSGVFCYMLGRRSKPARDAAVMVSCLYEMALSLYGGWLVTRGEGLVFSLPGVCGLGLDLTMDGFRAVYVCVAAFMWLLSNGVFARDYFAHHYRNRNRYYLFTLLTEGATIGVFLGASLYTSFIFFEIMSLCSYVWVAHDENARAMAAAETYLAVAIIGGMATLMGMFLIYRHAGTLMIAELPQAVSAVGDKGVLYVAGALIAVGFGAKAGVFPMHIWLPKAHPVAPAPSSALLSGMLTKTGVFGLIVVTFYILPNDAAWGNAILILGVVTMFLGALLALFSVDLKRTLACSSMSQIGFILVGMGMGALLGHHNGLAVHGMLLHMVNHSLIKLTLFMVAGAVYMDLHKLNLNDIRGYGRKRPVLHFAYLMGYLGIIGMPGWNGFVSKSLLHESILEYVELLNEAGGFWLPYKAAEWVFLLTGGMTAAYMTKLYICIFWEKNDEKTQKAFDEGKRMPARAGAALMLSAVLLPVMGVFANRLMQALAGFMQPFARTEGPGEALNYFSSANIKGAAISLIIGAALYLLFVRRFLMAGGKDGRVYVDRWPKWLDLETLLYRPLLEKWLPALGMMIARPMDVILQPRAVTACLSALARIMDSVGDALALGLWKTIFTKKGRHEAVLVGNRLTWAVGRFLDRVVALLNRTLRRRHPIKTNFTFLLAAGWDEMNVTVKRVTLSVSFGLLLLLIGLMSAFIYVLTR